jgi:Ca2+/H+ antiporter, TMEM165/GDT1 family
MRRMGGRRIDSCVGWHDGSSLTPLHMGISPFLTALFFAFMAEMGDKTQLVALAFATQYSVPLVLTGVLGATLLVHLVSVLLGALVRMALPVFWVKCLAGGAFIGFGIWTLRGDTLGANAQGAESRWGPLVTVALTFFLAELGDKTMLATITLASQSHAFVMVLADGLAILAGTVLGTQLPATLMRYGAAIIFGVTGVVTLMEAVLSP